VDVRVELSVIRTVRLSEFQGKEYIFEGIETLKVKLDQQSVTSNPLEVQNFVSLDTRW